MRPPVGVVSMFSVTEKKSAHGLFL
jgi:hypothetical protein